MTTGHKHNRPALKTALLFIIFNRPDTTEHVFEAIRQARPQTLFIAADGPRKDRPGEIEKCLQARHIATSVNWDCDVKTLFQNTNLGCKAAVSTAITWFFDNVEEGIILEDDCLPDQSFFSFCGDLLRRYEDDDRIFHIGGVNFQKETGPHRSSYYFSRYPQPFSIHDAKGPIGHGFSIGCTVVKSTLGTTSGFSPVGVLTSWPSCPMKT
jgi:GT2 family glycosyltransferase